LQYFGNFLKNLFNEIRENFFDVDLGKLLQEFKNDFWKIFQIFFLFEGALYKILPKLDSLITEDNAEAYFRFCIHSMDMLENSQAVLFIGEWVQKYAFPDMLIMLVEAKLSSWNRTRVSVSKNSA